MITKKKYVRNEATGNAVWDLFTKMAAEAPSVVRTINRGRELMVHDAFGTTIFYDSGDLIFRLNGCDADTAVLFAQTISDVWPIRIEEDDGKVVISCEKISEQNAIKAIKAIVEE